MMEISKIDFFNKFDKKYLYDDLTLTLERKNMEEYINHLIENNIPFSYVFMDLDNFKNVNDTLGHLVGDEVLRRVTSTMIKVTEDKAIVSRYGGDEFVIVAPRLVEYDDLWQLCRNLAEGIRAIDDIPNLSLALPAGKTTATFGACRFPIDAKDANTLTHLADKALYRGKMKGKNCFIIYNAILHSNIKINGSSSKLDLEKIISYIYYQFTDSKFTLYENLVKVIEFVSNYFNVNLVTKLNDNNEFVVLNSVGENAVAKPIPREYFGVDEKSEDTCKLFYSTAITDTNPTLSKLMLEQNVHSLILIICRTKQKYYGHFRIDGRFERIWNQEEKVVFQTIASLYTMLCEINNLKW